MPNWIAPWQLAHSCPKCWEGWICEQHPDKPFEHDDCPGPGMMCEGLQRDWDIAEHNTREALGEPLNE